METSMHLCVFEQATGLFVIDSPIPVRCVGYSGKGIGKNNPMYQFSPRLGPIPQGEWHISQPFSHPEKGPLCFRLTPAKDTQSLGRSGFLIHGDSSAHPGEASEGCIVLPRWAREKIAFFQCDHLKVVRLMQREIAA
jgi:hypothetical protein